MSSRKKPKKINKAHEKLESLYKTLPETRGCLENIAKDGGESCGAWCCLMQNPSVLYVEFLYSWTNVLNNWTNDQIVDLFRKSLENYLSSLPTKGCVFWNSETKLCEQHQHRPFNCHTYGVIPDEEFKPRIERLRVLYDKIESPVFDQCILVETVSGKKVTKKDMDTWWKKLIELENSIGIDKKHIHDNYGGSYRTYHDHILLQVCPSEVMDQLQTLRTFGNHLEKKMAVDGLIEPFRSQLEYISKFGMDYKEDLEANLDIRRSLDQED